MKKLFILLITFFVAGCSVVSPVKLAPESTYTITRWPVKQNNKVYQATQNTLLVTAPMAAPGYASSQMVYVMVPYQLKSYANHRWVAPPASLLLPLIAERIRQTNYFKAVVTAPFSGTADYQLNLQLLTLQQEFLQPVSQVRLRMSATLMRMNNGEVISNRIVEAVIPASRNNSYSGVLATNQAAEIVSDQIEQFVIHALKK
ncbi:MAG: hypothetical protein A3I77_08595 [Gammaproteobacteria bacterium RIFCSPLOWO2_02_FULL_42_14]|nr:MAG: hypothetical protein A3B71_00385 [Gammaproteobacteria bacterium RIFCSPHIGHO2_02_FULL_42_43]OGT50987.1 MAG: hypothetical protein A3E54_00215 [Gammaproteobacteria bacterium RIFCSPHIGHO2_12_FULL_41_25]OGT63039.1 MAG: hypothetical protein A3I77_08595 [Gammaproteobacteria bacterium RIFCSPLOWO2_02_FULL_42_14]OGT85668.1 MAG: hypothetical protein A3G86_00215 [Gammaproteobacteria bacterium RIFCSPLOWO2_12_FULL_42_18]